MSKINKDHFEKILFQGLVSEPSITGMLCTQMPADIFSRGFLRESCRFYLDFFKKHDKLPSNEELRLFASDENLFRNLVEAYEYVKDANYRDIDRTIFFEEAENFIKERLAAATITEVVENFDKNPIDPEALVQKFERVCGIKLLQERGYDIYLDIEKYIEDMKKDINRISTGYNEIDAATGGGTPANGKFLGVVSAPTNTGKSIMLGNLAVNALKQEKNVLIVTLEMPEFTYATRIYSDLFDFDINQIAFKEDELRDRVKNQKRGNMLIKEFPPSSLTVEELGAYIDGLVKSGLHFDLICVDYLTLLRCPYAKNSNDAGRENTRKLRALTYKFGCPIWTACQINRDGMREGQPEIQYIAESIAIAAEADLIISLFEQEGDNELNIMRVCFLKNRLGRNKFSIQLTFNHESLRFENPIGGAPTQTDVISPEQIAIASSLEDVIGVPLSSQQGGMFQGMIPQQQS